MKATHLLAALCLGMALSQGAVAQSAPPAASPEAQVQRQQEQPLNNAPVWREVRSGAPGYTTVKGVETGVLIQSGGETWRQLREPIALGGGVLFAIALGVLGLYFTWKGPIKLHDKPTGRMIQRFTPMDRIAHWSMAISFVVLAITGLIMTFGKYILIPTVGYTINAWLVTLSKNVHNFVGPIFAFALAFFIVRYIRDNLPKSYDGKWLAKAGGMLSGEHVPSGRFNAGEKVLFWVLVFTLSTILVISGLVLNFPNFGQSRAVMQLSNVAHFAAAMLGIAMAMFHIYLGTVGMKGAYEAMRYGYVDETWAKEHHEIWYQEVKAGKARQKFAEPPADAAAEIRAAVSHG